MPIYIFGIVVLIYSLIVFYGCYYVGSNFFIKIICKANTTKKEIAITFDDGPAQNYTPQILEILNKENIKATFFCIGKNIMGNENILKQIDANGHLIGNHSYSHHFWFDMYSAKKMQSDLQMMDNEMEKVLDKKPKLFRPPYGVTNPNVKKAIVRGCYTLIGWSVRSMDTVATDENKLLTKIVAGIKPGAVFLFHDTCLRTANVLPKFIQEVKNRGYSIVPLDKLLLLQPYA
ncbi:MAG: polysaccharide deacetylase family protein [Ferruginibacter sp.]